MADPAAGIAKLGFRKWYERELIKCHAALVTCFLCGLTVAALLEQIHFTNLAATSLMALAVVFAAVALGWVSWRSYITALRRAELYGERSTCPGCSAYGRFQVVSVQENVAAEGGEDWPRLGVECRRCATRWTLPS